jgi:hypothetical protein
MLLMRPPDLTAVLIFMIFISFRTDRLLDGMNVFLAPDAPCVGAGLEVCFDFHTGHFAGRNIPCDYRLFALLRAGLDSHFDFHDIQSFRMDCFT